MTDEDPPNIIPFGKHKGKTIQEVQIVEPGYLDWLIAQPWFRDRHVILYQTVINRGAEPEETPDHNALQCLFLENAFCLKLIDALGYNPAREFEKRRAEQLTSLTNHHDWLLKEEQRANWDMAIASHRKAREEVIIEIGKTKSWRFEPLVKNRQFEARGWDVVFEVPYADRFQIEIKPTVGDDYPAVLRQINALRRDGYGRVVLFLERYIGVGATCDQFIAVFKQAGITVIFRDWVE